jgi:hypothetical protein
MSSRSKTIKRITPVTESPMNSDQFQDFLSANAEEAFNREWHKLERGLRLNRIREFVEKEKTRGNYSDDETKQLLNVLMKAFDKKLLNTKNVVVYNKTTAEIEEIKGLVMHRGANGIMLFQLLEKKTAVTFRKPRADSTTK